MNALDVRDLTAHWNGSPVVRRASIALNVGSLGILLGSDGVAKSTLLQAIAGITPISEGSVMLDGSPVHDCPPHRRVRLGLTLVGGTRSVFGELTTEENIWLTGREPQHIDEAFRLFPALVRRRSTKARVLSGGEQQMLVLARALISKPSVLLVDGLSNGLAHPIVANVWDILRSMARAGTAILVAEQAHTVPHNLDATRWILRDGTVRTLRHAHVARTLRHDDGPFPRA